jgi:putative ABC transport system permease protein
MNLWRDVRFGFRLWRKNYGFAAVAVLTLALGIGATTAIFSVIYATLFEPLPYHDPEQLVVVWSKPPGGNNSISAGDFQDWQQQNKTFQTLATSTGAAFNLAMPGSQPEMIDGGRGTPGFYDKVIGENPGWAVISFPKKRKPAKITSSS